MKAKAAYSLALGLTLVLLLAACAPPVTPAPAEKPAPTAPAEPVEVVIAQPDDPPTFDPQKPGGAFGGNISYNIFEPLVWQTPDMATLIPKLATEWELIDETTWQFKLRQGVKFQNGEDFNAEAVKYTVERMLEPDAVRALYSFGILDRVEIIDDYTVNIHTKSPDPILPSRCNGLFILPPKYTAEVGEEEFGMNPIGTGPYRLSEFKPNQQLILETWDGYWGEKPQVDRLIFKPVPESSTRMAELRAGTSDIILQLNPDEIDTVEQDANVRVEWIGGKRVPFINLDLLADGPEVLKDKRVRQAMNYAVDAEAIVDSVLSGYGQVIATMFRPDFVGYDPTLQPYPHDPEKAKELLTEAGYPDGFKIAMNTCDQIFNKGLEVAEAAAGQLGEVGIEVEVKPVALQAMRDLIIGGQETHKNEAMWTWNWGARDPDPDSPLTGFLHSEGISTFRDPSTHPDLDRMIDEARSEMDPEMRAQMYVDIQHMIYEDPPIIFLYVQADLYGVNNRLEWSPRRDQYVLGTEIKVK